jgi:hypothetical protein
MIVWCRAAIMLCHDFEALPRPARACREFFEIGPEPLIEFQAINAWL